MDGSNSQGNESSIFSVGLGKQNNFLISITIIDVVRIIISLW